MLNLLVPLGLLACHQRRDPIDPAGPPGVDTHGPEGSDRSDTGLDALDTGARASDTGTRADTSASASDTASPPQPGGPPGRYLGSPTPRDLSPAPTPEQLAALTAGEREFAFALYRELADDDAENLVTSPHSVVTAFALLFPGAEGTTEDEMRATLRFDLPEPDLHIAFDRLDLDLASRGDPDTYGITDTGATDVEPPFQLRVVNALFAREGTSFLPPYLDTLARYYGTGPYALDFAGHPDESRRAINDWVALETHDKILDLLPEDAIRPDTVLALVNAIYFKAAWYLPFDPDRTADGPFTRLDDDVVTAPFMRQLTTRAVPYAEGDDWALVELPVIDTDVVFTVLVPHEGAFAALESRIDRAFFDEALASATEEAVDLSLPRFRYGSAVELSKALKAMGMIAPFGDADFSDLGPAGPTLGGVHHQGFVGVDEEGIEAAAASAVTALDSGPGHVLTLTVDRPFVWAIRDRPTGQILFLGRVTDPTQG